MLEVKNVTKKFTKKNKNNQVEEFKADDNISFTAKEGEVVGIIGPNGAGKTTLLRMIAGIMEPTSGEVLIDNKTHQENMIGIKKKIAFLSGNTKLYKDISPYELLEMAGNYYEVDEKTLEKRIKDIVKKFNMSSFLNQKISTLSTGQYQRTSIARCLVHNPDYYILDEATSGLDVISSKSILDFIKEVKKENKCIIYSTHYMEEAENICDKIVMINKGKVIAQGTPTEICKNTKTTNLRDSFFALIGDNYE
ncbi:aTP-binding transport protein NatA [Mycoplasma sp. CAG:877]|nr:aTP-binding transport protein NatA [Mycoplasma sp. CAG:877]